MPRDQHLPHDDTKRIENAVHEALENNETMPPWATRMMAKLDEVLERLADGDTAIALLEHRTSFLEKIVYGLCGTILLTVLGGIIALVVRGHT